MSGFAPPVVREVDREWNRLSVKSQAKVRWLMLAHLRNPASDLQDRLAALGLSPAVGQWAEYECSRRRANESVFSPQEDRSELSVLGATFGFLFALLWLIASAGSHRSDPTPWTLIAASLTSYLMWRVLLRSLKTCKSLRPKRTGGDAR